MAKIDGGKPVSASTSPDFAKAMLPIAEEFLGQPNNERSTRIEKRWGNHGSFSVDVAKGVWRDHESGTGGGVIDFIIRQQGGDKKSALQALEKRGFIEQPKSRPRVVERYDYIDEDGKLLYQVTRMDPKTFSQRAPDGRGGWNEGKGCMNGVRRVLYRFQNVLSAVKAGRTIFICEGEKAVHAMERHGFSSTCSPGGAEKWRQDYNSALAGADIVLVPDNDEPGRRHVALVKKSLLAIAAKIRIVTLPGLPEKGDAHDFFASGGTADQLTKLTADAPIEIEARVNEHIDKAKKENHDARELHGYSLTEDGIALAFAAQHQDTLRFDHTRGAWFVWTGKTWRQDETKLAFSWARRTCRQLAKEDKAEGRALATLAKAATAAAVERFAQSDPGLAVTSSIWDADTFLIGTPAGVVDLHTGQMRQPVPEDYISKMTAVAPAPVPDCPLWLAFLAQVTANDHALIRFLRAWCGYCLTGDTREHALVFAYGPGGNGKGVFLNTTSHIMGDYARNAAMDTFTASSGDKHPTDLAMLRGARLVTASETEEGRAWAESRIKAMTGGDKITARFMRQDFFEFVPQFKLTMIGNHKPILRNIGDAEKRRFNMVPFLFKPEKADKQLEQKLKSEWPAIFRWMIDGCIDWQMNGLVRPKVITDATAEYFSEQDIVTQWLEECCILGANKSETIECLFKSWGDYALASGEKTRTKNWLSDILLQKPGCKKVKNTPGYHGKRGFTGIELKRAFQAEPHSRS